MTSIAPLVEISRYVQIKNFLSPEESHRLLQFTYDHEAEFIPTTTSTGEASHRNSRVIHWFPELASLMVDKVQGAMPFVMEVANYPLFPVAHFEAQLTAHGDGQYYKIHNDNGSPEVANRVLTYVYYFHREPKAFSGGELVIYDSQVENGCYVKADSSHIIEPVNNSIVFFLSRYLHEVLPVRCLSQDFANHRFTVNGWVRHQA